MKDSKVTFIFSTFDRKDPFSSKFVPKNNFVKNSYLFDKFVIELVGLQQ